MDEADLERAVAQAGEDLGRIEAAVVMVGLAVVLRAALPAVAPSARLSYRALLGSLAAIARREPVLRRRCAVGGLAFASFSVFWSTIAFQVAHGPIGGGSATAGLLGVLGIAGVVAAPLAGRLAMRIPAARVNVGALVLAALSFAVFAAYPGSLIGIGAGSCCWMRARRPTWWPTRR